MTKKEMAAKLAKKADISVSKATEILNIIFDATPGNGIIAVELDAGRKVTIPGFGTFETKHRPAREGRSPATGEKIMIKAKKHAKFKPGKTLRDRVAE